MTDFRLGADDAFYGAYAIARGLVASRPSRLELSVEYRLAEQELGVPLGWRKVVYPPETEEGLETPQPAAYAFVGELQGRFSRELPVGESIVATINLPYTAGVRERLLQFVKDVMPGGPQDPVPPNIPEQPARRIRNGLRASEPGYCKCMLSSLRSDLIRNGPIESLSPTVLASARDRVNGLRAEFAADVHLPSALNAIVDVLEEIDRRHSPSGQFNRKRNHWLLRPLFDTRIGHPAMLAREVTAVAVSMGFLNEILAVADRYRDATSAARTIALNAQNNEGMLATIFEALPKVYAANDMYQALALLKDEATRTLPDTVERIAKSTEEELVTFAFAFAIQFSHLFLNGVGEDLELIRKAASRGSNYIDQVRAVFEQQFSYPSKVIDELLRDALDTAKEPPSN